MCWSVAKRLLSLSTVAIASVDLFFLSWKVGEGCKANQKRPIPDRSPLPEHVSWNLPKLSEVMLLKRGQNLKANRSDRLTNDSEMPWQGVSECDDNEGLSNKYEECLLNQSVQPGPSFTDERYYTGFFKHARGRLIQCRQLHSPTQKGVKLITPLVFSVVLSNFRPFRLHEEFIFSAVCFYEGGSLQRTSSHTTPPKWKFRISGSLKLIQKQRGQGCKHPVQSCPH